MSTHPGSPGSLWTVGSEPGRQVAALGVAAVFTLALLDVAIDGRMGLFFDLTFVALCVGLALRVAPGSFFYVGVLPPLIMAAVLVVVAIGQPLSGYVFVVDGVLIGAGDHRWLMGAMVGVLAAYVPVVVVMHALLPRVGPVAATAWLWVGFTSFMVVRGALFAWRLRQDGWMVTGAPPTR